MKKLRIFISSPGDVQHERLIAKKVIANLNRIYSHYVELDTIMWEDLPLEATASFQDGINYFLEKAPIDIAIFILWSRLGSKLGQSYKKPDGSEYQSGTEYEFDMMYALWKQTNRPKIMVYVKDAEPLYTSLSLGDIQEALEQKNKLKNFIEENFKDRETGTNYAYWQFDKQQTFEERLKTHLTRLIQEQIGENVYIKEWDGNPYVGLRSYEETEASIFCGRQSLIYDIAEHWIQQTDSHAQKPLLILGESGSGKSSLVKAGLIPYLNNMSSEKQTYKTLIMTPSEFRGNVYHGIVSKLLEEFPHLNNNPVKADLSKGIPIDYDFKYLQFALTNTPNDDITVFFFDQFEELFNDTLINEDEKKKTLQLLHGLCTMPHLWLIISMRNDFYSKFTAYPEFGALKNDAYVVDVPNVSATDIAEIVEIPAGKANLTWEVNDHGVSLSKRIIQEANELKDLPLIEFGLSELYNCKTGNKLTFAVYEEIGQLKGAVTKYADSCYESLTESEKQDFEHLLGAVITVSSQDENKYVRKTSLIKDIAKTEQQKALTKKLTDAHLFVTGKDANGESTITIVHEMLFSYWDVIKNWIEKQKELLNKRSHYESLAKHWDSNGRRQRDLIQDRSQLLDCEYFMYRNGDNTARITHDFLQESLKRNSKKGLAKHIVGFILSCFLLLGIIVMLTVDTSGIDFIDAYIDYSKPLYYLLAFIPLVFISIHAIIIRLIGKPKYKTIKFSFIFTILISICYMVCVIDDIHNPDTSWLALIWYIPLAIAGLTVVKDYRKRQLWKKGIFKPYLINDSADRIVEIVKWVIIGIIVTIGICFFGYMLVDEIEEKDRAIDKYKNTLGFIDELFDVDNSLQSQLSWNDQLFLNYTRYNLIQNRFENEIKDTIPDRIEKQVAVWLYNIHKPITAIDYLYPKHYWSNHILFIKALMKAGVYKYAEMALDGYVSEKDVLDGEGNTKYCSLSYASTNELIWIAEKLGRFDLAEQLYALIKENGEDIETNVSLLMNYGHIQLMKGNVDEAMKQYQQSMNVGASLNLSANDVKNIIANDFSTFHWLDVGEKDLMDQAAKLLEIQYKSEFYTSIADSITTEQIQEMLVGTWALADSSLVIEVNDIMPLCLYKFFDENKNEIARALTNCRYSNNENLYWEELDQNKNTNSVLSGQITNLSDSSFSIRIIDNGNESDKGKTRTYYRIEQTE